VGTAIASKTDEAATARPAWSASASLRDTSAIPITTGTAAALAVVSATGSDAKTILGAGLRLVRQAEARQRHAGQADAEFLQRRATCVGLGHAFGEFIEFIVHILVFCFVILLIDLKRFAWQTALWEPYFITAYAKKAETATAHMVAVVALASIWETSGAGLRLVRQPEARQRHAAQADAQFLQRCATRDGLGHALCEFIEFIVHSFLFVVCWFSAGFTARGLSVSFITLWGTELFTDGGSPI
jgi:hypothetical protein